MDAYYICKIAHDQFYVNDSLLNGYIMVHKINVTDVDQIEYDERKKKRQEIEERERAERDERYRAAIRVADHAISERGVRIYNSGSGSYS